VVPTKSQPFAHFRDGVLEILRVEVASDAEIMGADSGADSAVLSPLVSESSAVLVDEADAKSEDGLVAKN
jgi:hypothetical protein